VSAERGLAIAVHAPARPRVAIDVLHLLTWIYGRYRIRSRLAEGETGTVYLAEHRGSGRQVAVKVLRPERARDPEAAARFLDEIQAAGAVRDPHIVEVLDAGALADGRPYMVMELLHGESLSRALRRGRLPPALAVEYAAQAASGLDAIHARGIVHRDLKPDNLFLAVDPARRGAGLLKILDFGAAALAGQGARGAGSLGTPLYMSPEQCAGNGAVDGRSDIYALGLVLYEMLCGAPPFRSERLSQILEMHCRQPPEPLLERLPTLPRALAEVVHRALAKSPDDRFASAAEMAAAARAALRQIYPDRAEPGSICIGPRQSA
jgi:eukaryotic-like serine/threonine-protein kinase